MSKGVADLNIRQLHNVKICSVYVSLADTLV